MTKKLMRKELLYDGGLTARGTETRNNLHSKLPFASISDDSKSRQYKEIRAAAKGEEMAGQWLVDNLSIVVDEHCRARNWQIKNRSREMAEIALAPYVLEVNRSQQQEADLFGVSKSTYHQHWVSRADYFKGIVKRWAGV